MLRIYYANISTASTIEDMSQMSQYRREKLETTTDALTRRQGIAAERLLCHAALELHPELSLPLDIRLDEFGKPYRELSDFYFNLSHSDDYVVCAVSDSPVGVDIQAAGRYNERLAKRFFTQSENEYINSQTHRDAAFTKLWSIKESYLKAIGSGLRRKLSSFSVMISDEITVESEMPCAFWHKTIDDYHLAVCLLDKTLLIPDEIKEYTLP